MTMNAVMDNGRSAASVSAASSVPITSGFFLSGEVTFIPRVFYHRCRPRNGARRSIGSRVTKPFI